MQKVETELLATRVKSWIQTAAKQVRQQLGQDLTIQTKSNRNDLVTNVDRQNELFLVEQIKKAYPAAKIEGEESNSDKVQDLSGLVFFVDPIDGTMNFVKQQADFAIMIGVYQDGEGVFGAILDVMADKMVWGGPSLGLHLNEKSLPKPKNLALIDGLIGVNGPMLANDPQVKAIVAASSGARILGSAGVEFMRVLTGRELGYLSFLAPWDVAAGKVLAETVGLKVFQLNGKPLSLLNSVATLVATPAAFQEIQNLLS